MQSRDSVGVVVVRRKCRGGRAVAGPREVRLAASIYLRPAAATCPRPALRILVVSVASELFDARGAARRVGYLF